MAWDCLPVTTSFAGNTLWRQAGHFRVTPTQVLQRTLHFTVLTATDDDGITIKLKVDRHLMPLFHSACSSIIMFWYEGGKLRFGCQRPLNARPADSFLMNDQPRIPKTTWDPTYRPMPETFEPWAQLFESSELCAGYGLVSEVDELHEPWMIGRFGLCESVQSSPTRKPDDQTFQPQPSLSPQTFVSSTESLLDHEDPYEPWMYTHFSSTSGEGHTSDQLFDEVYPEWFIPKQSPPSTSTGNVYRVSSQGLHVDNFGTLQNCWPLENFLPCQGRQSGFNRLITWMKGCLSPVLQRHDAQTSGYYARSECRCAHPVTLRAHDSFTDSTCFCGCYHMIPKRLKEHSLHFASKGRNSPHTFNSCQGPVPGNSMTPTNDFISAKGHDDFVKQFWEQEFQDQANSGSIGYDIFDLRHFCQNRRISYTKNGHRNHTVLTARPQIAGRKNNFSDFPSLSHQRKGWPDVSPTDFDLTDDQPTDNNLGCVPTFPLYPEWLKRKSSKSTRDVSIPPRVRSQSAISHSSNQNNSYVTQPGKNYRQKICRPEDPVTTFAIPDTELLHPQRAGTTYGGAAPISDNEVPIQVLPLNAHFTSSTNAALLWPYDMVSTVFEDSRSCQQCPINIENDSLLVDPMVTIQYPQHQTISSGATPFCNYSELNDYDQRIFGDFVSPVSLRDPMPRELFPTYVSGRTVHDWDVISDISLHEAMSTTVYGLQAQVLDPVSLVPDTPCPQQIDTISRGAVPVSNNDLLTDSPDIFKTDTQQVIPAHTWPLHMDPILCEDRRPCTLLVPTVHALTLLTTSMAEVQLPQPSTTFSGTVPIYNLSKISDHARCSFPVFGEQTSFRDFSLQNASAQVLDQFFLDSDHPGPPQEDTISLGAVPVSNHDSLSFSLDFSMIYKHQINSAFTWPSHTVSTLREDLQPCTRHSLAVGNFVQYTNLMFDIQLPPPSTTSSGTVPIYDLSKVYNHDWFLIQDSGRQTSIRNSLLQDDPSIQVVSNAVTFWKVLHDIRQLEVYPGTPSRGVFGQPLQSDHRNIDEMPFTDDLYFQLHLHQDSPFCSRHTSLLTLASPSSDLSGANDAYNLMAGFSMFRGWSRAIYTGGHPAWGRCQIIHMTPNPPFAERCAAALQDNGWLASDEALWFLRKLQDWRTDIQIGPIIQWSPSRDLQHLMAAQDQLQFTNQRLNLLLFLLEAHWCAVEVDRRTTPVHVVIIQWPTEHHTTIVLELSRILQIPPHQMLVTFDSNNEVLTMCGWTILFRWYNNFALSTCLQPMIHVTDQYQAQFDRVILRSQQHWNRTNATPDIIHFASECRSAFLSEYAANQPDSRLPQGVDTVMFVGPEDDYVQEVCQVPRPPTNREREINYLRTMLIQPAWMTNFEVELVLRTLRLQVLDRYLPCPLHFDTTKESLESCQLIYPVWQVTQKSSFSLPLTITGYLLPALSINTDGCSRPLCLTHKILN